MKHGSPPLPEVHEVHRLGGGGPTPSRATLGFTALGLAAALAAALSPPPSPMSNEQSIMIHEICAAYSSVVVFLNKDYCHMLIYNPYNHQSMPLWTAEPL